MVEQTLVDYVLSVAFFSGSVMTCAYAYRLDRRFMIRFKEYVMLYELNPWVRRFGVAKGSLVNIPVYVIFTSVLWMVTEGNLYVAGIIPAAMTVGHLFAYWRSYRRICKAKGVARLD